MLKFSLLITIYQGTKTNWLDSCLASIRDQHSHVPDEIIMVCDGPIPSSLDAMVTQWGDQLPLVVVRSPHNLGPGGAAAIGLDHCRYDWVARLDADDIAMPNRFNRQLSYLYDHPEVDVLSGYIAEFSHHEDKPDKIRRVPVSHQDIVALLPYRCPINNSCVIFRRSLVQQVGGYEPLISHEDYLLWIKMLRSGAVFANLPTILIKVRMGPNAYHRRRGWQAIKQEVVFQNRLLDGQYISRVRYMINLCLRVPPRLLPLFALKLFYQLLLRRSTSTHTT